jgi:hypothetical protein
MKKIISELTSQIMHRSKKDNRAFDALFDSISGSLIRNDYDELKISSLIKDRNSGNLFDSDFLEKSHFLKLQDMWRGHETLASAYVQVAARGLGTPNAASGAGELFLLLSSSSVTKPSKGDVSFTNGRGEEEIVELKSGGKISSDSQYRDVNDRVLKVCEKLCVDDSLPTISSKQNYGKKQFLPYNRKCQKFIESLPVESRIMIWRAWWDSQNLGSCLPTLESYTWSEIMWEWMWSVVNTEFKSGITAILIIKRDGSFIVWRSADDAIGYYKSKNEVPSFEFRAAQKNSPAFYVPT